MGFNPPIIQGDTMTRIVEVCCRTCAGYLVIEGPEDEWICDSCVTRRLADTWFSRQPHIGRDAAFDAMLEAEIEREELPEKAVNDALGKWLYAPISRVDDVSESIQEAIR